MRNTYTKTHYLIGAVQALLCIVLFFKDSINTPLWLQVGGRLHPLLLHLPIGIFFASAGLWLFRRRFDEGGFQPVFQLALVLTALTSALTALAGLFLSLEGGYDEALLTQHQWTGIFTSWLAWALCFVPMQWQGWGLGIAAALMTVAGHFGASMTHGKDFLTEPLMAKKADVAQVITDSTPVFDAHVMPILKQKCFSCHNEQKTKGELLMTDPVRLLKGGKHGPIWKAGDVAGSLFLKRICLPMSDDEHMPPAGRPQVTEPEIAFLRAWVAAGADLKRPLNSWPEADSMRILASALQQRLASAPLAYTFPAASPDVIEKLNDPFLTVRQIASGSPALEANFFVRKMFDLKRLDALKSIEPQLVSLNLSNMPIRDEHLAQLTRFTQLEYLNLNNTDIEGSSLATLSALPKLRVLSLTGTAMKPEFCNALAGLPALKEVFLWNTAVSETTLAALKQQRQDLKFDFGAPSDTIALLLPKPQLVEEKDILEPGELVALKHSLPGVVIHYTTDGTDPDSLKGLVYDKPIRIEGPTCIKTLAVKAGWRTSRRADFCFVQKGIQADSAVLLTFPTDIRYMADGPRTLIDNRRGEANNNRCGLWLGYYGQPLEALIYIDKPVQSITIGYGFNVYADMMPPESVEIWAGDSPQNLRRLIVKKSESLTDKDKDAVREGGLRITLPERSNHKVYKLIVRPLHRFPSWHGAAKDKKKKAWIFIDEILFE
jgi:Chitobiase/beta-hexosaminidase C-terminal domain/Planctomycete cytochrome C